RALRFNVGHRYFLLGADHAHLAYPSERDLLGGHRGLMLVAPVGRGPSCGRRKAETRGGGWTNERARFSRKSLARFVQIPFAQYSERLDQRPGYEVNHDPRLGTMG